LHTILTDNGIEFTYNLLAKPIQKVHKFDEICLKNKVKHRFIKFAHPSTNGQVERFNRTLKENTTKRYFYANKTEFKQHLALFLQAYNFGKRLRILKYLTPMEKILDFYKNKEGDFKG
jgi:transposase InsO family protein